MRSLVAAIALVATLLTGCSMAPALEPPRMDLPQGEANLTIDRHWWAHYNDKQLDALMQEAFTHNLDLQLAAANVAQARAALGLASAQRYPRLDATASASHTEGSRESFAGTGASYENYAVSGVLSYELDLFGRLRDTKSAAQSTLLAMEANRQALQLSLGASVAESYFSLLVLSHNLQALDRLIEAKEQGVAIRREQHRHGTLSALKLHRIEADLHQSRAQRHQLKRQKEATLNALALLSGQSPQQIAHSKWRVDGPLPEITALAAQLPSDLLHRRPDVMAAEKQLEAANYQIGAARAAWFPSLNLTTSAGYQSQALNNLMSSGAATTQVGAAMTVPIFDFGRIRAGVAAAEAGQQAALIGYLKSVQQAFSEVHDGLQRYEQAAQSLKSLQAQRSELQKALELTEHHYTLGSLDYTAVIEAKGAYLGALSAQNSATGELLAAQVQLYKALGGGWQRPDGH